jgi:hypothetical protein
MQGPGTLCNKHSIRLVISNFVNSVKKCTGSVALVISYSKDVCLTSFKAWVFKVPSLLKFEITIKKKDEIPITNIINVFKYCVDSFLALTPSYLLRPAALIPLKGAL